MRLASGKFPQVNLSASAFVTSLTITNPGAETGDSTGWVTRADGGPDADNSITPNSGSFYFAAAAADDHPFWTQDISIPLGNQAAVDAGRARATLASYQNSFTDADVGGMTMEFFDGSSNWLGAGMQDLVEENSWTQNSITFPVPENARTIRIGFRGDRVAGGECSVYTDDWTLDMEIRSDDTLVHHLYGEDPPVPGDWTAVTGTGNDTGTPTDTSWDWARLDGGDNLATETENEIALAGVPLRAARAGTATVFVEGVLHNTNDDDTIRIAAQGLNIDDVLVGTVVETNATPQNPTDNTPQDSIGLSGLLGGGTTTVRLTWEGDRVDGTRMDSCVMKLWAYMEYPTEDNWDDVLCMIGCEDADDGDTTVINDGSLGTVSFNTDTGSAGVIDDAQAKFGTHSFHVTTAQGNMDLGTGAAYSASVDDEDKTWECHARFIDFGPGGSGPDDFQVLFDKRGDGNSGLEYTLYVTTGGLLGAIAWDSSNNVVLNLTGTNAMSVDTWYHIAITREGDTWRGFVDGVLEFSGDQSASIGANLSSGMVIGQQTHDGADRHLVGWMDEIRITNNIARYTAAFTPPSAPFPRAQTPS